jgi:dephospho-CoA kinase
MKKTPEKKTVYLLIGPKGSGKSFLGELFQQHLDIPFIRVEDWAREIKRARAVTDAAYIREIFERIHRGIVHKLEEEHLSELVFESTGLTDHFDRLLADLKRRYRVVTIRISADPDLCLERVRTRDQAIHVKVSDAQVEQINAAARKKDISCDFQIDNSGRKAEELTEAIRLIVGKVRNG